MPTACRNAWPSRPEAVTGLLGVTSRTSLLRSGKKVKGPRASAAARPPRHRLGDHRDLGLDLARSEPGPLLSLFARSRTVEPNTLHFRHSPLGRSARRRSRASPGGCLAATNDIWSANRTAGS
jgi:hypothetical protein